MSTVGKKEIFTQRRVVAFFRDALGYAYLGNHRDRRDNANVEKALLADWLARQGHGDKVIDKALDTLDKAVVLGGNKTLYDANRKPYHVFLHIFPRDVNDLVSQSRHSGFDAARFGFKNHSRRFNDKCMATIPLPDYDIASIRTGQYARDIIWEESYNFKQKKGTFYV